jgi:hypothetical protein
MLVGFDLALNVDVKTKTMLQRLALAMVAMVLATGCGSSDRPVSGEVGAVGTSGLADSGGDGLTGETDWADHDDRLAPGDRRIASAVKARLLADNRVGGLPIDLDATNGIVMLNGDVRTRAEANRAATLARGIPGVRNVVDNLQVER